MASAITFSMLFVNALSDGYTCCYGKTCPLPIFYQSSSMYQYFIDNGVIKEDACCPSGRSGSIASAAAWDGDEVTLESACRCSHSQVCDSNNLAYSQAYTCDGGGSTDTGCPDAAIDSCWHWGVCGQPWIELNDGGSLCLDGHCLCTYNAGQRTSGMTQRCDLATTLCVEDDTGRVSGEYERVGLYYGFPQYEGPIYHLLVDRYPDWTDKYPNGIPKWSFKKNESTEEAIFDQNSFESFDDITSFDGAITYADKSTNVVAISRGYCQSPTSTTTQTTAIIPTSSSTQYMPASSSNDDGSGLLLVISVVAGCVAVSGVCILFYRWRQCRKEKENQDDLNYIQHIQK